MEAVERYLCQEGRDRYQEAVELNDTKSQCDPENEPFKSKYEAREKWLSIKTEIESNHDTNDQLDGCFAMFLVAVLDYRLGTNFMETEELSTGNDYFQKCIALLEKDRLKDEACNTLQMTYNQMGILWSTRRQPEKALEFLQKAEQLYLDYKKEVGNAPYQSDEIFGSKESPDEGSSVQKRSDHFEHCFTLTQYYMAQVYVKLEQNELSAKYCHSTLKRQLETKKYDPVDWALNAATLSQFYMTNGKMNLARHCLASSHRILLETGEPVFAVSVNEEDSQADVERKEKVPRCWADLYRCWIKYGLSLLEASMTRLIEQVEEGDVNQSVTSQDSQTHDHNADKRSGEETSEGACSQLTSAPTDNSIDKDKVSDYFDLELTSIEEEITDQYVKVFEEARPVFLKVQDWIGKGKKFYALDGHCTDHVELIQDHSKAFKLLAFFEMDFERQCKMHKRRVDMLEAVLKELNSQFYLMICRQLMYEIAETYSAMLDLKSAIIEELGVAPTPHAVKKINRLAEQSISEYEKYIDTLKTDAEKTLPAQFSADDERPALIAYFCMGRLHSKVIEIEISEKLAIMRRSMECYKFLVDYCKRNPSAQDVVKSELALCEEMVVLMPMKMEKLRAQAV